mgnify:CR=1 FL=1
MSALISVLILVIAFLVVIIKNLYESYKIYYNNYYQCLKALSEYDKDLANFLKKEGE